VGGRLPRRDDANGMTIAPEPRKVVAERWNLVSVPLGTGYGQAVTRASRAVACSGAKRTVPRERQPVNARK